VVFFDQDERGRGKAAPFMRRQVKNTSPAARLVGTRAKRACPVFARNAQHFAPNEHFAR
jgi:hypothetical protein